MGLFTKHTIESAPAASRPLLTGIKSKFGFIPTMFDYMAGAPTTIEAYLQLNELVSKTSFSVSDQQIALMAVSVENECDFCVKAHKAIGKMKGANLETLLALSEGREIVNSKDRALVDFVRLVVKERGRLTLGDQEKFIKAGFTQQNILEVMLIVSIKTLSNYINHLTQPEVNSELR
tara:strand:- start:1956 stop:2486 length:531 start_codon:yes stop_codon:yes gene_type:complete